MKFSLMEYLMLSMSDAWNRSAGSAAARKGMKLAGARLIAHKKRWKNTPKKWESRPHKAAPTEGISRQVRRRLLRKHLAGLASRAKARALLELKIRNGIIGETGTKLS